MDVVEQHKLFVLSDVRYTRAPEASEMNRSSYIFTTPAKSINLNFYIIFMVTILSPKRSFGIALAPMTRLMI